MGLYAHVDFSSLQQASADIEGSIAMQLAEAFVDIVMEMAAPEKGDEKEEMSNEEEETLDWELWDGVDTSGFSLGSFSSDVATVFQDTFLETARSLCPVRTGYLLSTIRCNSGGGGAECVAGAEYAQYVEYGTYKMSASPYFEPAIQAGIDAARQFAHQEISNKADDLSDMMWDNVGFFTDIAGSIGGIAIMLMMMAAIAIISALVEWFISELTDDVDRVFNDVEIQIM